MAIVARAEGDTDRRIVRKSGIWVSGETDEADGTCRPSTEDCLDGEIVIEIGRSSLAGF